MIEAESLQSELGLGEVPGDWKPRYNIAPSQPIPVVTDLQSRRVDLIHWGLIPSWAKDPSIGNRLINARAETLQEKPSFRQAYSRRRCLILADGFYEWQRGGSLAGKSIPFHFHLKDQKPFAFAGLWDTWLTPEKEELKSCTIITCQANELVAPVHERMPVILSGDVMWMWMAQRPLMVLNSMLVPYPAKLMDAHQVTGTVNDPHQDHPGCVLPAIGIKE
jgi:putative SOS response-associated peptidase YedK